MKKTAVLLSAALMTAGMIATASQAHAANSIAADGQSGTSDTNVELVGGTIKLVTVPDINFAKQSVPTVASNKISETPADQSIVTVSDARGTGAGYTVDVTMSKQFTSTETHELTGSTLSMSNKQGTSVDDGTTIAQTGQVDLKGKDSAGEIINAGEKQGLGTWNYQMSGVNLNILPGMYAGAYEGELTWTLATTENP